MVMVQLFPQNKSAQPENRAIVLHCSDLQRFLVPLSFVMSHDKRASGLWQPKPLCQEGEGGYGEVYMGGVEKVIRKDMGYLDSNLGL